MVHSLPQNHTAGTLPYPWIQCKYLHQTVTSGQVSGSWVGWVHRHDRDSSEPSIDPIGTSLHDAPLLGEDPSASFKMGYLHCLKKSMSSEARLGRWGWLWGLGMLPVPAYISQQGLQGEDGAGSCHPYEWHPSSPAMVSSASKWIKGAFFLPETFPVLFKNQCKELSPHTAQHMPTELCKTSHFWPFFSAPVAWRPMSLSLLRLVLLLGISITQWHPIWPHVMAWRAQTQLNALRSCSSALWRGICS